MKTCTKCKKRKQLKFFGRDATKPSGMRSQCRHCEARTRASYYRNNPKKRRIRDLKFRFGITIEEYDALKRLQRNRCAICRRKSTRTLCVDHCHKTGIVRELLCDKCNTGLGQFDDRPSFLARAKAYLEKHKSRRRRPVKSCCNGKSNCTA